MPAASHEPMGSTSVSATETRRATPTLMIPATVTLAMTIPAMWG
jgi:hypothetical protein